MEDSSLPNPDRRSANAPSFPAPPHGRPGSQEEPRHGRRHGGRSLGGQHQGCGEGTQPGGRPRHPENKHHEHALREVQDPKHSPVHLHLQTAHGLGKGGAGRQTEQTPRQSVEKKQKKKEGVGNKSCQEQRRATERCTPAHLHDDRFAESPVMVHLRVICDVTCRTKTSGENSLGLRHDCTHLYPEHY